jgi:hypothetical protein
MAKFIELGEGDHRRLVNLEMVVVVEPRGHNVTRLTLKNGQHLTFDIPFQDIALCIELAEIEETDI